MVAAGDRLVRALHQTSEDDTVLEGQMDKTTAQANAAIDEALTFIDASTRRMSGD
jgi:hypothetical protein